MIGFYFLFIDDAFDDIFNLFLFQFCNFVGGTVFVSVVLDDLDIFQVVDLRDDHILLKIRSLHIERFGHVSRVHFCQFIINLKGNPSIHHNLSCTFDSHFLLHFHYKKEE